jgi:hypothetical protein
MDTVMVMVIYAVLFVQHFPGIFLYVFKPMWLQGFYIYDWYLFVGANIVHRQ